MDPGNQAAKRHSTARSCLASLPLDVLRTRLSQLWRSSVENIHFLDHLLDVLSDSEQVLGYTFFAAAVGAAFGMLWPISPAQNTYYRQLAFKKFSYAGRLQDPYVDLPTILAMALCCLALHQPWALLNTDFIYSYRKGQVALAFCSSSELPSLLASTYEAPHSVSARAGSSANGHMNVIHPLHAGNLCFFIP